MNIKALLVVFLSSVHILLGLLSFFVGIVSSVQTLVWSAHAVSPLFCGLFFVLCGSTGLIMSKQRTQYSIFCFAALNSITLITSVVNMQLLRLGLVNHTTLGKTFQKENKDVYIIIGLVADGCELLMCLLSILACIKLNKDVKNNRFKSKRKEGAFFVQVVGDKDIVVIQSKHLNNNKNNNKLIFSNNHNNNDNDKNSVIEGEIV